MKIAEVELAGTVTDAGTFSSETESLASATRAPPAGAPWLRVTVHRVAELGGKLVALHCSEEMVIFAGARGARGARSDSMTGFEDPASDAVTVAL